MRKLLLLFLGVFCLLCPSEADIRYALPPIGFEEAVIPAGWTQENVEGTVNWQVEGGTGVTLANPAGANAGSYRLAIRRVTGSATSFVTRLISPAMDLTEMQNPELCFAHAQVASFDYFDTLRVYYRTTSTAKWTLLREFASPVSVWTTESIPLEKYLQGTAYQIAFEVSDHAGKGVVLDDICVLQPSICQKPLFQMVQPTSTTAFIEFVAGGTGYGSTADLFDLIVSDSLLADLTTIPNFISWVLVYAIALAIFSTDGFINTFLTSIGHPTMTNYLLSDSHMWLKMLAWGLWKGLGWSAIIYIASISGIDQQLYEAATVDGAGRFAKMWFITIPELIPTYMVLLLMSIANILSNGMEQYLVFSNSINKNSIEVLDLYVYNLGITSGLIPISTVIGMVKSIISVILLFAANSVSKLIRGESIV